MKTIALGVKLLYRPGDALADPVFNQGRIADWFLSQLPLWVVLVLSGFIDPAEGMTRNLASLGYYAGASLAIVGFSMVLNTFRSFLLCWFARLEFGFGAAIRALMPVNCLTALLEAATTLLLLPLKGAPLQVFSQVQVFGLELLFAVYAANVLMKRENVPEKRAIWVSLACFLLSSGWHLLSVFFG